VETKNVLETAKTQAEKSEEKFSTNEILEISNQAIQSQMKTPIESREENEDWLWRQQYAKETLRRIPDDVKLERRITR